MNAVCHHGVADLAFAEGRVGSPPGIAAGATEGQDGSDRQGGRDGFATGLLRILVRGKWFIVTTTVIGCLLAGFVIATTTRVNMARMLIQSVGQQGAAGAAGAITQLTAMLGGDKGSEDREFSQFQWTLRSVAMAERLQRKYGLMQVLFGYMWDPVGKRWIEPKGWRYEISAKIREWRGLPRWVEPSVYDLADLINAQVQIKLVSYSRVIYEMTFENPDLEFGLRFIELLQRETENALREERKFRVTEQARYLRTRIETTVTTEYRQALTQLLGDQDKMLMLLDSNLPVATSVLDPPHPMAKPGKHPAIAAAAGVFGGLAVGALGVLGQAGFARLFRRRKPRVEAGAPA